MYSDQFSKYQLPIDKSKVDWSKSYMKYGGSQLFEILEKEFDYYELPKLVKEAVITESQYDRLKTFVRYGCDLEAVFESTNHQAAFTSFFYKGAGMLAVLMRKINMNPVIQNDQFVSRFSFLKYKIMKYELGFVVISEIEQDNWYSDRITPHEKTDMTRMYFYDKHFNKLELSNPISKDLHDVYEVTKIMLGE